MADFDCNATRLVVTVHGENGSDKRRNTVGGSSLVPTSKVCRPRAESRWTMGIECKLAIGSDDTP